MKIIASLLVFTLLSGCANMTPRQKQTAVIAGSIIVGAVIISANEGDTTVINNDNGCRGRCDK